MYSSATDLTKEKPFKVLLSYSLPFIAATFLQALINITDVVFVGHSFGTAEASAVGIGGQLVYLAVNSVTGLAAGGTIIIAKAFVKDSKERIKSTVTALFCVFAALSVIFGFSLFFLAKPLLSVLSTPSAAFDAALSYVKISAVGLVFVFFYNGAVAVIRGSGNSMIPLYLTLATFILNLLLDFLFISALRMAANGAAIATALAHLLSAIPAFWYIFKKTDIFKPLRLKTDIKTLKNFLKIGLPVAFLNLTATLSFMFLTLIVNRIFKDSALEASAVNSIAARFNGFAALPSRAMASAVAVIVAQNIGAKKSERNKVTLLGGILLCLLYGAVIFILTFFFTENVLTLLGAEGKTVTDGTGYMKAMSFDYIILPLGVCAYGLIEGYGKTYVTMIINVICSLLIRVPAAYLFAKTFNFGLTGIGLSIPAASLAIFILTWSYILFAPPKRHG